MWGTRAAWIFAACSACGIGCERADAGPSDGAAFIAPFVSSRALAQSNEPISPLPLPEVLGLDPERVALGETLFNDPRLSGDGTVTCAQCHSLSLGGANAAPHSALPKRPVGGINVPSVLNSAFFFRYAWNGRFETLEDQLDFAMTAPAAMAGTWTGASQALENDHSITDALARAYPNTPREYAIRDALVTYVRSLVTPNSRFDKYLRGEAGLEAIERRGYQRFKDYGCVSCHQGINVGGNMFQRFGVMRDYFKGRDKLSKADLGFFAKTGDEQDKFVFRVPSLRNVALTSPYFHDGSVATLEDAARTMARYQLGRELTDDDAQEIAAFLRTLTGELNGVPL